MNIRQIDEKQHTFLPDHKEVPVAPLKTHKVPLYSLCKLNKLVSSQEKPPVDHEGHDHISFELQWR